MAHLAARTVVTPTVVATPTVIVPPMVSTPVDPVHVAMTTDVTAFPGLVREESETGYMDMPDILRLPQIQLDAAEPSEEDFLSLYGASELFAQLDKMEPREPRRHRRRGGRRDTNLEAVAQPEEEDFLALYGASELFAQLDEMKPRRQRKRRGGNRGRRRVNELGANSEESTASSATNAADRPATSTTSNLINRQMNLYGAADLYAQLAAENGLQRTKKRWTPTRTGSDESSEESAYLASLLQ